MSESAIHPQAAVSPEAKLGAGVTVGAFAVIGAYVTLGEGCVVHSHAVIHGPSKFGANNIFHPFSAVGVDPQDLTFKGERTELIVGDGNSFRESVTVSRGTKKGGGTTKIGNRNLFMAYTHIGHDSVVGSDTIFANAATVAGHGRAFAGSSILPDWAVCVCRGLHRDYTGCAAVFARCDGA